MGTLEALSLAMGAAWTSGINLYATVAVLGIAGRMEMIQLPPRLDLLMHPGVIGVACLMYLIEFFADKVPYVDSGWDALHTFIRIPAGAVLAAASLGELTPALELMAILAGGAVAASSHSVKAATRLAINTSPEPFTNWTASVAEDVTVLGALWLIFNHPVVIIILLLVFLAAVVWIMPKLVRVARRGFQALRDRLSGIKPDRPAPTESTT
jgi:hypothetical protein